LLHDFLNLLESQPKENAYMSEITETSVYKDFLSKVTGSKNSGEVIGLVY